MRHGETDWNAEARLQGQQDIALNAVGRFQAEQAGRRLAELAPDAAQLRYLCSPLGRTRETMEIMRRSIGLPPGDYSLEPRFAELTFGDWEGLTWREVRRAQAELAAERERDKWSFVPPNGESYAMLAERVAPAIDDLPERSVVVSHGGVARALLNLLSGLPEKKAPLLDIWQGRVLVFDGPRHRWH
ncbi:histidine phosphatase family protein [Enterovirga sp.]|uniref:histidine phosphatase family protein n=1 Tax=Enterovirga sp. TaxID=2026350 RepID=UPI002D1FB176|nr:histidine phosphatase family protein [Enterovirga sp.]